jgi:hypothetical protein
MNALVPLILLVVLTRGPIAPAGSVTSIEGSYVAQTMNGRALPSDLRIPVTDGNVRLFRLEQGVLRLSEGGRFTLYFRYYHQLVRRGTRPVRTPVMADSESGAYSRSGQQLILVPTKKKGESKRPTVTAQISGDQIRASYVVPDTNERVTLLLQRDARYW